MAVFDAPGFFKKHYQPLDIDAVKAHAKTLRGKSLFNFVRAACLADPLFLLSYVYGHTFKWFHRQWMNEAFNAFGGGVQSFLVLGPRGSAKSTAMITGTVLWILLHEEAKQHTMGVISTTKDKATEFMGHIKNAIESDDLITLFGDMRGDVWKTDRLNIKGKSEAARGYTLRAFGRGGSVVGQHFTLGTFCDDLVDEEMVSEHFRKRLVTWWDTSLKYCIEPGSIILSAGTRYHPGDFYQTMLDRGKTSINTQRSCWIDEEKTKPLWPERGFTYEKLKEDQKDNPVAFQLQMENEVSLFEGTIFRREWFRSAGTDLYSGDTIVSVDIAFREKRTSDYSAITVLKKTPQSLYIVEACVRGRWTGHELRDKIVEMRNRYGARIVLIEDAFENRSTLGNRLYLTQDLRTKGVHVQTIRPHADKVSRYYQVQPLFECGQVLFRPGLDSLQAELIAVPSAEHDDQADSLTQGLEYMESTGKQVYSFV